MFKSQSCVPKARSYNIFLIRSIVFNSIFCLSEMPYRYELFYVQDTWSYVNHYPKPSYKKITSFQNLQIIAKILLLKVWRKKQRCIKRNGSQILSECGRD